MNVAYVLEPVGYALVGLLLLTLLWSIVYEACRSAIVDTLALNDRLEEIETSLDELEGRS